MKTLVDYMTAEDFAVYQELQEKALAAKAANPTGFGRKLTTEEKIANAKKKLAEYQKKLAELTGESV